LPTLYSSKSRFLHGDAAVIAQSAAEADLVRLRRIAGAVALNVFPVMIGAELYPT